MRYFQAKITVQPTSRPKSISQKGKIASSLCPMLQYVEVGEGGGEGSSACGVLCRRKEIQRIKFMAKINRPEWAACLTWMHDTIVSGSPVQRVPTRPIVANCAKKNPPQPLLRCQSCRMLKPSCRMLWINYVKLLYQCYAIEYFLKQRTLGSSCCIANWIFFLLWGF